MNILAIILARKDSKRIKGKNRIVLNKKKLIEHTFILSKKIKVFKNILLSSNDEILIKLAKNYRILAPWKRPESLSGDKSSSYKAVIHAYNWYKKNYPDIDGIFLLQPTSPFRSSVTINKMIDLFKLNNKKPVVCVSKCIEHPEQMLSIKNKKLKPYFSEKHFRYPSQKLKTLYRVNGLGYLINPKTLINEKTLVPKNSICYINNSRVETIDIDDKNDLNLARKIK